MGRKKLWPERVHVLLPAGAKSRMEAVLKEGETTLDLIRGAIDTEVGHREQALARKKSAAKKA